MQYDATETKKFKQASIGTHTGICYMIADIGTHETEYEGERKSTHQIMFGWQLPEELNDDGTPLSILKTYTLSFVDNATLAKHYKSWTKDPNPKTFSFDNLIGSGCNITVGHTSGGNAKVTGVSALKANEKVPALTVPTVLFDLRNPNLDEMAKLPNFIKEKITDSPEYQAWVLNKDRPKVDAELDDSIPF